MFKFYFRCPASNTCSGLSQSETLLSRSPAHSYPATLDKQGLNLLSRAEPDSPRGCCKDVPEHQKCNKSCQKRIQNSETALAVDVGFYLNFSVNHESGMPGGCPAFDYSDSWKNSRVVDCGLNDHAPEGEALHEIVEDFAENQDHWIRDFLTAFDKMSRNGNTDLDDGPTAWYGASCRLSRVPGLGKIWSCEK